MVLRALGFTILCVLTSVLCFADTYEIINQTTTTPATGLKKTVIQVQVVTNAGTVRNPLNRINITRVRKSSGNLIGPVLLRSPFNFDARSYEITRGTSNKYKTSFLGNLASKRLDVWVVDDRMNKTAAGSCESNAVDCSVMSAWGVADKLNDIEFARTLIEEKYPDVKPILGGFVGGSIDAMAALNANPDAYSGFFGWEGSIYTEDQAIKDYNTPFCQFAQSLLGGGAYYLPGADLLKILADAAQNHPNDPAPALPFPGIPSGLTNKEVFFYLLTNHTNDPNFPTPTWIMATGTYQPQHLNFTQESQLYALASLANHYVAVAPFADYLCGLMGVRTFNNNLGNFEGAVLLIGNEFAFGGPLQDTAELFTNADSVKVKFFKGHGEQDLFLNKNRKKLVDKKFIRWAKDVLRDQ